MSWDVENRNGGGGDFETFLNSRIGTNEGDLLTVNSLSIGGEDPVIILDWDDATLNGVTYMGFAADNAPEGVTWTIGRVEAYNGHLGFTGVGKKQTVQEFSNHEQKVWTRAYNGITWSDWILVNSAEISKNLSKLKPQEIVNQFYANVVPELTPSFNVSESRLNLGTGRLLFLWFAGANAVNGYFNIQQPPTGYLVRYLSNSLTPAARLEVTDEGIQLPQWYTLWYTLPIGQGPDSIPENFFTTLYTGSELEFPDYTVRIATSTGLDECYLTGYGKVPSL